MELATKRHGGASLIFGGPQTVAVVEGNWRLCGIAREPKRGSKEAFQTLFSSTHPTLPAASVNLWFFEDVLSEMLTFGILGGVLAEIK